MLRIVAELDEFKGYWSALGSLPMESLASLQRRAIEENIGSASRNANLRVSDSQVQEILSSREPGHQFKTRGQQDAAGYAEVLASINSQPVLTDLSENHIRQMHRDLFYHSTQNVHDRGVYRSRSAEMDVFGDSHDPLITVNKNIPVGAIPRYMTELVEWTRMELDDGELHPVLVIAVFMSVFSTVRPFETGNGRLARIVGMLGLRIAGYDFVPFQSIEPLVEETRSEYRRALMRTAATIRDEQPDWQPWLDYILEILLHHKRLLEKKIELERQIIDNLPPVSELIMEIIEARGRASVADIQKATHLNRNTIKGHFQSLKRAGRLRMNGAGRGAWYSLN